MSCSFKTDDKGILMHVGKKGVMQRVIFDIEERQRIVKSLHADPVGGSHFGQNATIKKVCDRFYWKSVSDEVRQYVKTCERCQKANPSNKPPPSTLHPVPVGKLFHRWGIDLVGPLNETPRGNKYICVATEYLTRWPEAQALHDKSAEGIHAFVMGLVYRFGCCNVLLHDQGREFNNNLVNGLCEQMKIGVAMTSAYHPQSNG